jgi:endoglycosylceramidase
VARSLEGAKRVLGYDLINEPWPGTTYLSCVAPAGCPAFEQGPLAALQAKVMDAIRAVDASHVLFYEPALTAQAGGGVLVPNPTGDQRAGMSFHVYCALSGLFAGLSCDDGEERILAGGLERANANGGPGLVTEFGGTQDPEVLNRMTDRLDRHMASWQFWAYDEHLVPDMHSAPSGTNVLTDALGRVERPYPQVVAGTPQAYAYDREANTFTLRYTTARAAGGTFGAGSVTEVFVPRLHYPDGYAVDVEGARVLSPARSSLLRLAALPGADEVQVSVHPGRGAFPRVRPAVRIRVTPKRDRRPPFRLRVAGRIILPPGTARDVGCTGRVRARARVAGGPASARSVLIGPSCRFTAPLRVRGRGAVRVRVRYAGNEILKPAARTARTRTG